MTYEKHYHLKMFWTLSMPKILKPTYNSCQIKIKFLEILSWWREKFLNKKCVKHLWIWWIPWPIKSFKHRTVVLLDSGAYLESSRTSTIKPFCKNSERLLTIFLKKLHRRYSIGLQIHIWDYKCLYLQQSKHSAKLISHLI